MTYIIIYTYPDSRLEMLFCSNHLNIYKSMFPQHLIQYLLDMLYTLVEDLKKSGRYQQDKLNLKVYYEIRITNTNKAYLDILFQLQDS